VGADKKHGDALSVFGAWRYRNKVLHRMDFIFSSLGASISKKVLKANFGRQWKPFIRSYYDQDIKPNEAAALSSLMCLRGVLTRISQDEKNLALHAIRTDNRANMTANRLRSVHAGIALYGTDATAKAALYEIIGSLEGRDGAELDDYRTRQLLADALDMISPTQVPRDFTGKD
jgi:hypothetical protein